MLLFQLVSLGTKKEKIDLFTPPKKLNLHGSSRLKEMGEMLEVYSSY
jgi:hypothetical protein